jgi:hypothetical protein
MHGTRRGDARSTGVKGQVAPLAYDFVGVHVCPVGKRAVTHGGSIHHKPRVRQELVNSLGCEFTWIDFCLEMVYVIIRLMYFTRRF